MNYVERDYSVNHRIKVYMEQESKRPSAIADKANIRRDVFSRILHCRRVVFADEIIPLAKALGVSVGYLLGEDEQTA